jgi:competence protein ComGC
MNTYNTNLKVKETGKTALQRMLSMKKIWMESPSMDDSIKKLQAHGFIFAKFK